MNIEGLPPEVVEFVTKCIRSIEELDVLVLLAQPPVRSWTVEEVDQVIRSTPKSVKSRLENLYSCGMLMRSGESEAEPRYRFKPATPEKSELAEKVLNAYKIHRLEVIELIYSTPARTMVSFSDAFKIRGDKKDDS